MYPTQEGLVSFGAPVSCLLGDDECLEQTKVLTCDSWYLLLLLVKAHLYKGSQVSVNDACNQSTFATWLGTRRETQANYLVRYCRANACDRKCPGCGNSYNKSQPTLFQVMMQTTTKKDLALVTTGIFPPKNFSETKEVSIPILSFFFYPVHMVLLWLEKNLLLICIVLPLEQK